MHAKFAAFVGLEGCLCKLLYALISASLQKAKNTGQNYITFLQCHFWSTNVHSFKYSFLVVSSKSEVGFSQVHIGMHDDWTRSLQL